MNRFFISIVTDQPVSKFYGDLAYGRIDPDKITFLEQTPSLAKPKVTFTNLGDAGDAGSATFTTKLSDQEFEKIKTNWKEPVAVEDAPAPTIAFQLEAGSYMIEKLNKSQMTFEPDGWIDVLTSRVWRYDIDTLDYNTFDGRIVSIKLGIAHYSNNRVELNDGDSQYVITKMKDPNEAV